MSETVLGRSGSAPASAGAGRLCVFEEQTALGERDRTWLIADPLALQLNADPPLLLPDGCLSRVFERYGQPFDEAALERGPRQLEWLAELKLPQGNVRRFRHRSWFDVVARDYLVFDEHAGRTPRAAGSPPDTAARAPRFDLCTSVAAALTHLATAYARACISPK